MFGIANAVRNTEDVAYFREIVDVLRRTLPCEHCRMSFDSYCREMENLAPCTPAQTLPYIWSIRDRVHQKLRKHCSAVVVIGNRQHDHSPATNAVHMLYYIHRNQKLSATGGVSADLSRLLDLCTELFVSWGDSRWEAARTQNLSVGTDEALYNAHRLLLPARPGYEQSATEVGAWYDAAALMPQPAPHGAMQPDRPRSHAKKHMKPSNPRMGRRS